jgi:hypothetical protein
LITLIVEIIQNDIGVMVRVNGQEQYASDRELIIAAVITKTLEMTTKKGEAVEDEVNGVPVPSGAELFERLKEGYFSSLRGRDGDGEDNHVPDGPGDPGQI